MFDLKSEIAGHTDGLMNICGDVATNVTFEKWDLPEEKIVYWITKQVQEFLVEQREWRRDVAKDFTSRYIDYIIAMMRLNMAKETLPVVEEDLEKMSEAKIFNDKELVSMVN